MRDLSNEVFVLPTTDRDGASPGAVRLTEVIRICGTLKIVWREVIASIRDCTSVILTPESHLADISQVLLEIKR